MSPKFKIDQIVKELLGSILCDSVGATGCTAEEIKGLEAAQGHPLPKSYSHFLKRCGKGAGKFLVGTDWKYDRLANAQRIAHSLVSEPRCTQKWQPTWFVFAMHQGYQFLFFDCEEKTEPAVFHYLQGDAAAKQVAASFAEWLEGCVKDEISICASLVANRTKRCD